MRKPHHRKPSRRLLRIAATIYVPVRAPTKAQQQAPVGDEVTKVNKVPVVVSDKAEGGK